MLTARKFILRDPSNASSATSNSILEQYLPSSVYGAGNGFATSLYSDPTLWFNNNFNYATPPTANNMPIRALLTARNGVSNFAPNKFNWKPATATAPDNSYVSTTLYNFGDWVIGSDKRAYVCINAPLPGSTGVTIPIDPGSGAAGVSVYWAAEPWSNAPTKTSANTANFNQLWAAYWSVMWDKDQSNKNADSAGVPPACDTTMFRQPTRDSGVTLTPRQTLVLRAGLAALNTMQLRSSANKWSGVFGDVLSRAITIPADDNSPAISAELYGADANPYITEVYADNSDGPQGYVAIELYNPFPVALPLKNWQMALVQRPGPTIPPATATVAVTRIVPPLTWLIEPPIIPPYGFLVLANRRPAPQLRNGSAHRHHRGNQSESAACGGGRAITIALRQWQ